MDACGVRNLDSWAGCAQVIWTLSSLIFKNTWIVFIFPASYASSGFCAFFYDCASRGRSALMWHLPQKPSSPPAPQACILWGCFLAGGCNTSGFTPRSPLGQTQHSLIFTACREKEAYVYCTGPLCYRYGSPDRTWSQNQACMQYTPL